MTDQFANLKSLDLDAIRPIFDELAGHRQDARRCCPNDHYG